jgi:hypothetical protein
MNKMFQNYIVKAYLVAVFTFCCLQSTCGQNKMVLEVQKLQQDNVQFVPVSPLTIDASIDTKEVNKAVSNATLAKADDNKLNEIASGQWSFLELEIPYQNQNFKIQLYRVNPFSDNFSVDTDRNKDIQYQKGVYYRGMIKGNSQSVASFNFFNGTFNGVFSSQELGNIVVGKMDKPNNQNDYVIYSDANFLQANEFECHVNEKEGAPAPPEVNQSVNTLKCVNLYFEIDYNLFQSNNSSTTQTANWMTSVFNNVQTLFANDGITVALNALYIWTNPDVFQNIGSSSADYLYGFADYRPTINGDVGMLVGIDPGGLGGVAFLNSICQNYNYAYSDLNGISVSTVPTYSWTSQVITHEFGHSFGSPHTHACVWNGNNTPIDGCGIQAGAAENGCTIQSPIPSTTVKGTIMSYCHLVQGVGISFANGFGIQPTALMVNTVNAKPCLSTDCISSCYNTATNVQATAITNNSATITWADFDASVGSWQVSVTPLTGPSVWNTVSQSNYQVNGLLPNTYYRIRLRSTCTSTSTTIIERLFITNGDFCGSLLFTDTGGSLNNYSNNQSFMRTIIPNLPSSKIVVTFTQFSLEDDYDFLYVYDGPDDTYSEFNLGAGFTGTNTPGTVTSTAVDGSLTFKFRSDQFLTDLGWVATIACLETLNVNSQDYIDFSYYPNPTKNTITLKSNTTIAEIDVFNIQGRKLFSEKLESLDATVDLSQFASGTYFFKVRFDTNVIKNFKVLKM